MNCFQYVTVKAENAEGIFDFIRNFNITYC